MSKRVRDERNKQTYEKNRLLKKRLVQYEKEVRSE